MMDTISHFATQSQPQVSRTQKPQGSRGFVVGLLSLVIFVASTFALISLDIYPDPSGHGKALADTARQEVHGVFETTTTNSASLAHEGEEVPVRIVIDAIGVDASIENPASANVATLDNALLSGVVHYPGSGNLDSTTNMFLFGHSSGLPVIHNQNFKVFNRLSELESGNLIRVQSANAEHVYRVTRVRLTTESEAYVEFNTGRKQLTLSTCNSFGDKSERWVVEADFIGSYPTSA